MHVLVSGGSGFLGRQIVAALRKARHLVSAPRSAQFDLLDLQKANHCVQNIQKEAGPIDSFVHSAAYYGGIGITTAEPATIFNRNSHMILNAFELTRQNKITRMLPIGSACAYPGYLQGVMSEAQFWDGPLHQSVEAYGFMKKTMLVAQHAYHRQHGLQSNHLIITNLYGPHDVFTEYRSHVVSALIKKFSDAKEEVTLWGDGTPLREFLYVDDAAEAVVRAIELPHDDEPINVGTGVGSTIRELAELVAEFTGFKGRVVWDPTKPNGAAQKVLNIDRMRQKLRWEPPHDLRSGLKKTIEWYLANKTEADKRQ